MEILTSKRNAENNHLDRLVRAHKKGEAVGITSICSANPFVIEASLLFWKALGLPVLIESTCNQVNQYGGYTRMKPLDFKGYLERAASKTGYPFEQIILGGDHLGPNVWKGESAEEAMAKACVLMRDYVQAGYTKIHLDASMRCRDDPPDVPLDKVVSARRAAELARASEDAFRQSSTSAVAPRYIIGTEVPAPGGVESANEHLSVTPAGKMEETIALTKGEFLRLGLEDAWERVIAVVVQPGVEFGDQIIYNYRPDHAVALSQAIDAYDSLVYEVHSTDFQTRGALRELVRDHFAILKVGPGLTFAFREAVFALSIIEHKLFSANLIHGEISNVQSTLDQAMLEHPEDWTKYYSGDPQQQRFARMFSFSDRSRYSWPYQPVQEALNSLLSNLSQKPIPLSLLSQFMPLQYQRVREGRIDNNPRRLVLDKITSVLFDYAYACGLEEVEYPRLYEG